MSESPCLLKSLNFFQSVLCGCTFVALITLLVKNMTAYTPPSICPSGYSNIYNIIIMVSVVAFFGTILKLLCCKLNDILYYPLNFISIALLGFNIYTLHQINSNCKEYYTVNYDNLWYAYTYSIIFQFVMAAISLINLIYSIYTCC